jgi:hypothetical protein
LKAQQKAEAQRYKFVTEPGRGLAPSEIETVPYTWEQVLEIGGLQMHENVYLLLKDGTVHDGLPVPPQDMDVQLSRRKEPRTWGRWRRDGGSFSFAWADKPDAWHPQIQAMKLEPGRKGVTLTGAWSTSSSFAIPGGAGAWSVRELKLAADGRYERASHGGSGMTSSPGGPGSDVVTGTVWDDKGSVTSASAPGVAIGVTKGSADKGDRTGRYGIDGYMLLVHYDNGGVARLPFALSHGKSTGIWHDGALMSSK